MGLSHRTKVTAQAVCCVPCVTTVLLIALPVLVMSAGNEMATVSPSSDIVQRNRCSFVTNQGTIDIWNVGNSAEPRFQYQRSSAPGDTGLYTFDPCYPFNVGACEEAMVCRFEENRANSENIGAGQPGGQIVFDQATPDPVLMFTGPIETHGVAPKITYVTLKCGDQMQEDTLEIISVSFNGTAVNLFDMVLTSPYCCPHRSGLSFGTVLIILFLCVVVIYLVVGILYNMIARGASGIEVIPNLSFWMDFPILVMDGVAFVLTCGKGVSSSSSAGGQSTSGTGPKSGYDSI